MLHPKGPGILTLTMRTRKNFIADTTPFQSWAVPCFSPLLILRGMQKSGIFCLKVLAYFFKTDFVQFLYRQENDNVKSLTFLYSTSGILSVWLHISPGPSLWHTEMCREEIIKQFKTDGIELPSLDAHSLIPQSGAPYKVVTIGRTNVVDQVHFYWEVIQVYIVRLKQFLKLKEGYKI